MVDNVSVTEGAGDKIIASDDVGGVQYQRIKLNWGPDGTANEADTGSRQAAAGAAARLGRRRRGASWRTTASADGGSRRADAGGAEGERRQHVRR